MDVIELIKADHDKVEAIFQQFQLGGNTQQFRQLFTQLYQELSVHSLAEENVVYPALAKFEDLSSQVKDLFVDQAKVKAALGELAVLDNTSNTWSTKMTDVMQDVLAHARQEETQVLPMMRQRMTEQELQLLGQEFQKAKQISMPAVQSSMPMKELGMLSQTDMSGMPMQTDGGTSQYA
jgi:hemerythrin superfamily protein